MIDPDRYEQLRPIIVAGGCAARRWCEVGPCACSGCVNVGMAYKFEQASIEPPTHEEWLEIMHDILIEKLFQCFSRLEALDQAPMGYTGYKQFLQERHKLHEKVNEIRRFLYG
jgi:hypothetical protein